MANEIQYMFELIQTVDSITIRSGQRYSGATGTKYINGKVDLTFTEEAVEMGEVTSPGWAMFGNDSGSEGTIDIRAGSGGTAFCTLRPGESCILPLSGDFTPFAKTDTSGETATLIYNIFSR